MNELFYIISSSVNLFLSVLVFALLGRVLIGFFTDEESMLYTICCAITEPVVSPVRGLLARIPVLAESPIDFSFMATCLIITILQSALPV